MLSCFGTGQCSWHALKLFIMRDIFDLQASAVVASCGLVTWRCHPHWRQQQQHTPLSLALQQQQLAWLLLLLLLCLRTARSQCLRSWSAPSAWMLTRRL